VLDVFIWLVENVVQQEIVLRETPTGIQLVNAREVPQRFTRIRMTQWDYKNEVTAKRVSKVINYGERPDPAAPAGARA